MTNGEMKAIRNEAGLSINQLAEFLYYGDVRGLRRMETGEQAISGPVQRVMELIRDGRCEGLLP